MRAKQTLKQSKVLARKPRRVRKQLGNGMSMLVSREEASKPREMWSGDIGCWAWGRDLNICFEEQQLLGKRSLWQRIKGWFA